MNYDELLLSFQGATLNFPFNDKTAVFKVGKKMFALVGLERSPLSINLKCDPDDAPFLRTQFKEIKPGYHMNKNHWNTIILDGGFKESFIYKLMEDSYSLVVKGVSQRDQKSLDASESHS